MFGRHPSDNQLEGKRLAASPPQPASMKSPGMLRRETHGSCCHSEAVFSIFSSSSFFKKSPSPFYVQKSACSLQISPFCCEPWPTHRDKSMPSTARHREGLLSYMSSPSDQVLHFCNKEGIKGSQHQKKKHFPETFPLVNLLFSSGAFFVGYVRKIIQLQVESQIFSSSHKELFNSLLTPSKILSWGRGGLQTSEWAQLKMQILLGWMLRKETVGSLQYSF